jgi:hypothetical protein
MGNNQKSLQLFRNSLDKFLAKDMKGWTDACDENIVAEFPFAHPGSPSRIEGRAALYEYLRGYPNFIDIHAVTKTKMYTTDDENLVIAEWSVTGKVVGNGNPYDMSYATFATYRDGLIINYREYWNPQAFLAAMEGTRFDTAGQ